MNISKIVWDYDREIPNPLVFPKVPSIPNSGCNLFWSVTIPVCDRIDYLEQTISSVVSSYGEADLEVVVVDNASVLTEDIIKIINKIDDSRIRHARYYERVGMAENWNRCIQSAKGEWIHILHDDDYVRPGYYEKLKTGLANSANYILGFTRYISVDEEGCWTGVSTLHQNKSGLLDKKFETIIEYCGVSAPSVVVKRTAYESVGGFFPGLQFALDWEMWKRLALVGDIYYEVEPLLCYRYHNSSETSRMLKTGTYILDVYKSIYITSLLMKGDDAKYWAKRAEFRFVKTIMDMNRLVLFSRKSVVLQLMATALSTGSTRTMALLGLSIVMLTLRIPVVLINRGYRLLRRFGR
ncbi:MAG TPA: glycosyltransferase [Parasulfuritortus sp.]